MKFKSLMVFASLACAGGAFADYPSQKTVEVDVRHAELQDVVVGKNADAALAKIRDQVTRALDRKDAKATAEACEEAVHVTMRERVDGDHTRLTLVRLELQKTGDRVTGFTPIYQSLVIPHTQLNNFYRASRNIEIHYHASLNQRDEWRSQMSRSRREVSRSLLPQLKDQGHTRANTLRLSTPESNVVLLEYRGGSVRVDLSNEASFEINR